MKPFSTSKKQTFARKAQTTANINVIYVLSCGASSSIIIINLVVILFGGSKLCHIEVDRVIAQDTARGFQDTGLRTCKLCLPKNFKCTITSFCQNWAFTTLKIIYTVPLMSYMTQLNPQVSSFKVSVFTRTSIFQGYLITNGTQHSKIHFLYPYCWRKWPLSKLKVMTQGPAVSFHWAEKLAIRKAIVKSNKTKLDFGLLKEQNRQNSFSCINWPKYVQLFRITLAGHNVLSFLLSALLLSRPLNHW